MACTEAAENYVDAEEGRDSNAGRSDDEPWQSIRRVNRARLQPGDTMRLRAGCSWRESLAAVISIPETEDRFAMATVSSFGTAART